MKVALVFHRFGPYHLARLAGAATVRKPVAGVELSAVDETYAWARCTPPAGLHIETVFRSRGVDRQPALAVLGGVARVHDSIAPTVVAIPGWSGAGALAALAWCRRRGVPAVLMSDSTAHDEPRVWWKEAVKRRVVGLYGAALVGGAPHVEYAAAQHARFHPRCAVARSRTPSATSAVRA